MIDLSVVIASWNASQLLEDCLRSVYEKTHGTSFEIIVVDDASTDDTPLMLKSKFPEVRLVRNESNLGFSGANNVGLKQTNGRYILLLNNDTLLRNDALTILVNFMETNPDVGICGGTLLNRDGEPDIAFGNHPSLTEAIHGAVLLDKLFPSASWVKRKGIKPPMNRKDAVDVDYISGADLLVRREVLNEIGYLDPQFTAYCEEVDLCLRTKRTSKWRVVFVPSAEITHLVGSSYGTLGSRRIRIQYLSYARFLRKYHSLPYALLVRLLYAFRYAMICATNFLRAFLSGFSSQRAWRQCLEAAWIVRYSLFPGTVTP